MPVVINDQIYYMTADVCRMIGISGNTVLSWLKQGVVSDVEHRNCRGWRLSTPAQVEAIRTVTNHVFAMNRRD